ncbi:hypothetical protein [Paraburkholderia xenovorans]|uniref:hypothetical protein n=1 Tax=Paraburkholderia xenovorans TaxID=36873 RepID=UPI0038BBD39E
MEIVVVELCYEGGTVLTDRVLLNRESAQVILPPRLLSLMEILDRSDQRRSFMAECGSVRFPVKHDWERGYFIDLNMGSGRKRFLGVKWAISSTAEQRKLNGRFAHMLSACALVGACFEIGTAGALSWESLLEPVVLCLLSVALFIVGHRYFAVKSL